MGVRDILAARAFVEFDTNADSAVNEIKRLEREFKGARANLDIAKASRGVVKNKLDKSKSREEGLQSRLNAQKATVRAAQEKAISQEKKKQLKYGSDQNRLVKEAGAESRKLVLLQKRISDLKRRKVDGSNPALKLALKEERKIHRAIKARLATVGKLQAARRQGVMTLSKELQRLKQIPAKTKEALALQKQRTASLKQHLAIMTREYKQQAKNLRLASTSYHDSTRAAFAMINPVKAVTKSLGGMVALVRQNRVAMLALGASVTYVGVSAAKMFKAVDDNLLSVKGIARASGSEFEALTKKVLTLGRTTSFTAGQVAEAAKQLSKAGFSAAEIQAALGPALDLSRATGASLEDTSAVVARTLSQFNLAATDTARVVDVLGTAVNKGVLTLEDMAESMKFLGPVGDSLGFTLEEVASSFTVLANNGLRGGVAARQLKRAFTELAKDDKIELLKDRLKVDAFEDGNAKPLSVIIEEIGTALNQLNPQKQLALLDSLFGEGTPAMAALTRNTEEFLDTLAETENSRGNIEALAKLMDVGLGGATRLLLSAVESLAVNFTKLFEENLVYGITVLKSIISRVSEWVSGNDMLHDSLVGVVRAIATLFSIITKAVQGIVAYKISMYAMSDATLANIKATGVLIAELWAYVAANGAAVTATTALHAVTGGLSYSVAVLASAALGLVAAFTNFFGLVPGMGDVSDALRAVSADADRAVEALKSAKAADLTKPYTVLVAELRELSAEYEKGDLGEEKFNRMKKVIRQIEAALKVGLGVQLNETTGKLEGIGTAIAAIDREGERLRLESELKDARVQSESLRTKLKQLRKDFAATGSATFGKKAGSTAIELDLLGNSITKLEGKIKELGKADLAKSVLLPSGPDLPPYGELTREAMELSDALAPLKFQAEFGIENEDELDKVFASVSTAFKSAVDTTSDLAEVSKEQITDAWTLAMEQFYKAAEDAQEAGDTDQVGAFKEAASRAKELMDAQLEAQKEAAKAALDLKDEALKKIDSDAARLVSKVQGLLSRQRSGALGAEGLGSRIARQTINLDDLMLREQKEGNSLLDSIRDILKRQQGFVAGGA